MEKRGTARGALLCQRWRKHGEPMTSFSGGVDKVLAPVPGYEEWKAKLEENTKLKELLKRAKEVLEDEGDYMIVQEINQALGEDKCQH